MPSSQLNCPLHNAVHDVYYATAVPLVCPLLDINDDNPLSLLPDSSAPYPPFGDTITVCFDIEYVLKGHEFGSRSHQYIEEFAVGIFDTRICSLACSIHAKNWRNAVMYLPLATHTERSLWSKNKSPIQPRLLDHYASSSPAASRVRTLSFTTATIFRSQIVALLTRLSRRGMDVDWSSFRSESGAAHGTVSSPNPLRAPSKVATSKSIASSVFLGACARFAAQVKVRNDMILLTDMTSMERKKVRVLEGFGDVEMERSRLEGLEMSG